MKEGSVFDSSSPSEKSSSLSQFIMPFFVILALIVVLLVGLYLLGVNRKSKLATTPQNTNVATTTAPTFEPTVTSSPSATPEPLKREDLSIAVLNGSGTAGAAAGISTRLRGLGYAVSRVGNADGFTYQDITVKISPDKKQFTQQLKTDVVQSAPNTTVTVEEADTGTVDAEVIVGR